MFSSLTLTTFNREKVPPFPRARWRVALQGYNQLHAGLGEKNDSPLTSPLTKLMMVNDS